MNTSRKYSKSHSASRLILAVSLAVIAAGGILQQSRAQVYSGEDQERRVRALQSEVHWWKSLTEAQAEAKKEHKMIFWVQMLGDMDGTT